MDGLDTGGLLNLIDTHSGVRQADIGKIELKGAYSFFEVDQSKTKDVKKLQGQEFQGRRIRLEITEKKSPVRGKSYKSDKGRDKSKKGKHRKGGSSERRRY
jgi:ATP-dependent RNA helicase DeaD